MKTSVETFRSDFTERTLSFVWRQWCQMGVSGSVKHADSWVIDPEPLLALTTDFARHDARVFDEAMDWLNVNGEWINTQRLSTILCRDKVGDRAVVGGMASWMTERDKSLKWRGLTSRMMPEARSPAEPLFRFRSTGTPAARSRTDGHFRRYGLLRPPIQTRGLTQPVNMKDPANAMFKSRAVFGTGIRADVMTFLMTSDPSSPAHARHLADVLGYNHIRVQDVLSGLANAGVLTVRPVRRTKQYRLDREKWGSVLLGDRQPVPHWVNWRALARGLTAIWRAAWTLDASQVDDYVFSSKMREAMRSARDDLHASGLAFNIEDDRGYLGEAYMDALFRSIDGIFRVLAVERT